MNKGKLYLVGLHIGNVEDVSSRTLRYIKESKNLVIEREEAFEQNWPSLFKEKPEANIISIEVVCKDGTPIDTKERETTSSVIEILNNGEDVYMISDEGMPGAADPGMHIIRAAIENKIQIIATPGPSIIVAAAAVTGVIHNFSFESFLPINKDQRKIWLDQRKNNMYPMIIVLRNMSDQLINGVPQFSNEIPELFEDAVSIIGAERNAALCFNLTKNTEFVVRGKLSYLKNWFEKHDRKHGDQITIVIDSRNSRMAI